MSLTRREFSRRSALSLALGAVATGALAACGGASSGSEGSGSKTLVVYSPASEDATKFLKKQAKADLGLTLKFIGGRGGELTQRLITEKNNTQADVVAGIVPASMYQLKAADVLQPYSPPWADALPPTAKDADGNFASIWQTPIVIAHNTQAMPAADAPAAWTDLADPKYNQKFVIGSLTSQTVQTYLAGILWQYADPSTGDVSDEGWSVLAEIFANRRPLPEGQPIPWDLVADGTTPIVLTWAGDVVTSGPKFNVAVDVVNTTGGTPFVYEAIGITSQTANLDNAKRYVDWFGSSELQTAYVKAVGNVTPLDPVALEAAPAEARALLEKVSPQDIDWSVAGSKLTEWMQKIQLDIVE